MIENAPDGPAAELLREVLLCEHAPTPHPARLDAIGAPRPPDAQVPSGAIWPPVEGRAILCELAQLALAPRRLGNGDWAAGLGCGWRVVSNGDAVFASLDQGRTALIQWARLHAGAAGAISPRRCIVLADDGARGWRLWQIVHADDSLRELLERALLEYAGDPLVFCLSRTAQLLLDAHERLARLTLALPCNLDTIGSSGIGPAYIGLMPAPGAAPADPRPRLDALTLLRGQLVAAIGTELREHGLDVEHVLGHLPGRFQRPEGTVQAVAATLGV
jgi:hypothetical protein